MRKGKSILEGKGKECGFGYIDLVMSVGHLSEKDMGLKPRRLVLRERERAVKINREKETDREIEG